MHLLSRLFCRTYQAVFRLMLPILPYREPECFKSVQDLGVLMLPRKPAAAAEKFIAAIRNMNQRMGIPDSLKGIRREDIPMMAAHAAKEANPLSPY